MAAALTVPLAAVALLLLGAGLAKLRDPIPATTALRDAGVAVPSGAVRLAAAAESALAGWALLAGRPAAALALALAFGGLAAVAHRLHRTAADCGCFGARSAPATAWHTLLTLACGAVAAGAALAGTGSLPDLAAGGPVSAAPVLVLAAVASAAALVAAYTDLPRAFTAWDGGS